MKKNEVHGKLTQRADAFDVYAPGSLRLDRVDLRAGATEATYDDDIAKLEKELLRLQVQIFLKGRRAVLAFEGWDAAGKGGAIKRLTAQMDPRGFKVWPIGAPKDEDARNHYLWRFWRRLPQQGEIAIFDRTWYGRVLVERVERYSSREAWSRAYDEINAFEKMLTDDGVTLVKFFLHIDKKTQLRRFKERERDPVKYYKMGKEDWRNRRKWKHYAEAIQDMLDRTHRPDAPWNVIASNDKKWSRLEVLRLSAAALKRAC